MVAVTPQTIIPTLDSQSILVDPRDKMGYILRWYFSAPKSISNSTLDQMISFADTASRYQANPNTLSTQVVSDLSGSCSRFFDPSAVSINTSTSDNGDGTYNLTIEMSVLENNQTYTLGVDVSLDSTGFLSIKWHPTLT